jgi:hypothetical protein
LIHPAGRSRFQECFEVFLELPETAMARLIIRVIMNSAMETTLKPSLREQIRLALVEHSPDTSSEQIEITLNKIMVAVDPFEKSAAKMLERYRDTFATLAK